MTECTFLIPIDSSKRSQQLPVFSVFHWRLLTIFGGYTVHKVKGAWVDTEDENGPTVYEKSRRYLVAVSPQKIDALIELLREFKPRFEQKKIYFSRGGQVELL